MGWKGDTEGMKSEERDGRGVNGKMNRHGGCYETTLRRNRVSNWLISIY